MTLAFCFPCNDTLHNIQFRVVTLAINFNAFLNDYFPNMKIYVNTYELHGTFLSDVYGRVTGR